MGVDIAVFMLGKLDVIISNSQKRDLRHCVSTLELYLQDLVAHEEI